MPNMEHPIGSVQQLLVAFVNTQSVTIDTLQKLNRKIESENYELRLSLQKLQKKLEAVPDELRPLI